MRRRVGQRQSGQAIVVAAVAVVSLVGALAMVMDLGMFFVVQRQLQSAADAGALAGAWYDGICPADPRVLYCSPSNSRDAATGVAQSVAQANANTIAHLCGGSIAPPTIATGTQLVRPRNVNTIVVTVECDAGYSFGRILNLTTKHITASSAAAIGDRDANGDMTDFTPDPSLTNPACGVGVGRSPDKCRIARLIQ